MDLYNLWYFEVEAQASLPPPRYAPDYTMPYHTGPCCKCRKKRKLVQKYNKDPLLKNICIPMGVKFMTFIMCRRSTNAILLCTGLILGFRQANERRRYKVTPPLIDGRKPRISAVHRCVQEAVMRTSEEKLRFFNGIHYRSLFSPPDSGRCV